MNKKIAIIGDGWVGKAMKSLFPDAYTYTRHKGKKEEVNKCDVVFICIPTPLGEDGRLEIAQIEYIISWLECPLIVIRSTVNPGDCTMWKHIFKKKILHQPEYLGETPNHPLLDEKANPFMIIGGEPSDRRELINLYTQVYNSSVNIRQVSTLEAEVIKLSENRAIAFKVMQCEELYDVCERANIDYYTVRDAVYGDDPRFNLWWTFIFPEKRGFNDSRCLVKDVPAWCAWAESLGYEPDLTKVLILKSNQYEQL